MILYAAVALCAVVAFLVAFMMLDEDTGLIHGIRRRIRRSKNKRG